MKSAPLFRQLLYVGLFFILPTCGVTDSGTRVKPESLSAWLAERPTIQSAVCLESTSSDYLVGDTLVETCWNAWTDADRQIVEDMFDRAWAWLYETAEPYANLGTDEFSFPIACSSCDTGLTNTPTSNVLTLVATDDSKTVYFSHLAHALALAAGQGTAWSLGDLSAADLHPILSSRAMMHRYGTKYLFGPPNFVPNARIKNIGRGTPATARWTYAWMQRNNLVKSTQAETVAAILQWARLNLVHFYGSATYQNFDEHWQSPSGPPLSKVVEGTIRTSESTAEHWTAGCHGTVGFVKTLLRAVNIPTQVIYTCGHSQLYFPTLDKYLDHGDNPYNADVKAAASKSIAELLISPSTYTSWFSTSPDFLNPADPLCSNVGRAADEF
jgi:hypothetical protein